MATRISVAALTRALETFAKVRPHDLSPDDTRKLAHILTEELGRGRKIKGDVTHLWEAYRLAYENRHHIAPIKNGMTLTQLGYLAKALPGEELAEIIAFYLTLNDRFYVQAFHPVNLLLRDHQAIRARWVKATQFMGELIAPRDDSDAQG